MAFLHFFKKKRLVKLFLYCSLINVQLNILRYTVAHLSKMPLIQILVVVCGGLFITTTTICTEYRQIIELVKINHPPPGLNVRFYFIFVGWGDIITLLKMLDIAHEFHICFKIIAPKF